MTSSRSATDAGIPIRLRGPGAMAAAMPYMLGFHPTESIVGIGLAADRRRVRLTARIDLIASPFKDEAAVLMNYLEQAESVQVVLLVVSELPLATVRKIGSVARTAARKAGLGVTEVIHVFSGRWRSLSCRNPVCCPPTGREVDSTAAAAYAAQLAAYGRAVLPDRDAVTASIAYDPINSKAVAAALDAAREAQDRLADQAGIEALIDEGERVVGRAVISRRDRPTDLTVAEIGELGVALGTLPVRDRALRWSISPLSDAGECVWRQLTRRLPPPLAAPAATLLAVWAYAEGDGTMAKVALERALKDDPEYGMAKLLNDVLSRAIPPSDFRSTMREAWLGELRDKRARAKTRL
jgi:hypothetical protein